MKLIRSFGTELVGEPKLITMETTKLVLQYLVASLE
jgi:hypothetical protein